MRNAKLQKRKQKKKKRIIDDEIATNQKNMRSDAEYYKMTRVAEANKELYTTEYLRYTLYSSLEKKCQNIFLEKNYQRYLWI